jgi:hypothetical protein
VIRAEIARTGKSMLEILVDNARALHALCERLAADPTPENVAAVAQLIAARAVLSQCADRAAKYLHAPQMAIKHKHTMIDGKPVRPVIEISGHPMPPTPALPPADTKDWWSCAVINDATAGEKAALGATMIAGASDEGLKARRAAAAGGAARPGDTTSTASGIWSNIRFSGAIRDWAWTFSRASRKSGAANRTCLFYTTKTKTVRKVWAMTDTLNCHLDKDTADMIDRCRVRHPMQPSRRQAARMLIRYALRQVNKQVAAKAAQAPAAAAEQTTTVTSWQH